MKIQKTGLFFCCATTIRSNFDRGPPTPGGSVVLWPSRAGTEKDEIKHWDFRPRRSMTSPDRERKRRNTVPRHIFWTAERDTKPPRPAGGLTRGGNRVPRTARDPLGAPNPRNLNRVLGYRICVQSVYTARRLITLAVKRSRRTRPARRRRRREPIEKPLS